MDRMTHQKTDAALCGKPVVLKEGFSRVELETRYAMAVDDFGLIHGGFIFGLADYAAMLAVNHPNVVLGSAEAKFLKPVSVGDTVTAEASVTQRAGKKSTVQVTVKKAEEAVFEGTFVCFSLDQHVLA